MHRKANLMSGCLLCNSFRVALALWLPSTEWELYEGPPHPKSHVSAAWHQSPQVTKRQARQNWRLSVEPGHHPLVLQNHCWEMSSAMPVSLTLLYGFSSCHRHHLLVLTLSCALHVFGRHKSLVFFICLYWPSWDCSDTAIHTLIPFMPGHHFLWISV